MSKSRLEAFSDGVIAIIITVMVLELKVPHGSALGDLRGSVPTLLAYALSYVYVGIYWNNHHHMLHATRGVNGTVLWANLHLLFWLSLVPFVTAWLGEHRAATWPVVIYGFVLFMAGFAYSLLRVAIIAHDGRDSLVAQTVGTDTKGLLSLVSYLTAIGAAFIRPWIAEVLYVVVAAMWFVPDRRIERRIDGKREG
jgi:uncharacterized membrane protein